MRNNKLLGFPSPTREEIARGGKHLWVRNPDEQSAELSMEFGLDQKIKNRRARLYCLK
ncbi:MAG: hypothetical protein H6R24_894 [Proteobacteria bacterium]|nr:hypothetical protein [Pseudomonadota bacterium]